MVKSRTQRIEPAWSYLRALITTKVLVSREAWPQRKVWWVKPEFQMLGEKTGREGEWVTFQKPGREMHPLSSRRSRPAHKLDLVQPG